MGEQIPPCVIREFDGVQIALVGVTTPMTIRDSAPKYFMDDGGHYIYGFFQYETGAGVCDAVQEYGWFTGPDVSQERTTDSRDVG